MKHIPTSLLPALALLTLGSCATSNGLTTTEPDGVYYSSKDRTTQLAAVASPDQPADYAASDDPNAVANPDYQDGRTRTRGTASDEYYDDDYDYYPRTRRYNGLGMGYNLAYADPYWYRPTFVYNDPFFYGGYGFGYSPWYDPFWGPGWYGGSMVNINIGWGRGGWGPWGPYGGAYGYNPWGYGYGGYGWGGYGRGYWDNGYYGGGWGGYYGGGRVVTYRGNRRNSRSVEVVGANGASSVGGGGRGRVSEATGGRPGVMTTDNNVASQPTRYRGRVEEQAAQPGRVKPGQEGQQLEQMGAQTGRGRLYRIQEANPNSPELAPTGGVRGMPQGEIAEQPGRNRGRVDQMEQPVRPQADGQPQYQQPRPRRERYVDYGNANNQEAQQPRRERVSEPVRTYEAPTRSYDQPSRSWGGGGNSGGGSSSGGSGGGGGRGRVR